MFHSAATLRSARMVLTLSCIAAAGCAGVRHAQTTEPILVAPSAAPAVVEEAPAPAVPQVDVAPAVVEVPVPLAPPPAVQPVRPVEPAPVAPAPVPKVPAKVAPVAPPKPPPSPVAARAAVPVPPPQAKPKAAAVAVAPQLAPAPLDFKLPSRLRETKAIGVLTKLSLKNQVDDLWRSFAPTTSGRGQRRSPNCAAYDMLLLKVLSLLQDSDPPLAGHRPVARGDLEHPRGPAEIHRIQADGRSYTVSRRAGAWSSSLSSRRPPRSALAADDPWRLRHEGFDGRDRAARPAVRESRERPSAGRGRLRRHVSGRQSLSGLRDADGRVIVEKVG